MSEDGGTEGTTVKWTGRLEIALAFGVPILAVLGNLIEGVDALAPDGR